MRQIVKSLIPVLGVALVLGGGQAASASIISSSVGHPACHNAGADGCAAEASYVTGDGIGGTIHTINFNDGTTNDPNSVATYSSGWGINGASSLGDNTSNYLNINSNSVTITFAVAIDYFGLQWGSPDGYNSVTFYRDDLNIASFTGAGSDAYISFNAVGETFNKIVLASSSCCFETDNHAYVIAGDNAAPEPGTLTTVGTIMVALPVYLMWRRRRYQTTRSW